MVDLGKTGKVTFTFRCNTPRQVYLVGDFNDWNPVATPMVEVESGVWVVTIKVAPGQHEFRYREDGDIYHTDFAAFGVVRNAFGGFNSLVDVEPPIRLRVTPERHAFSGSYQYN